MLGIVVAVCAYPPPPLANTVLTRCEPAHQLALSMGKLDQFILHAPRESLVSANKEGLISVTGESHAYVFFNAISRSRPLVSLKAPRLRPERVYIQVEILTLL